MELSLVVLLIITICIVIVASFCGIYLLMIYYNKYIKDTKQPLENFEEVIESNDNEDDRIPHFKELSQEQIDDIHSRGKITPKEKVKEWEDMDLCAPGDAVGGAAWRCKKFNNNCHNCLVDYANEHDEYTSFYDILKNIK